MQQAEFDAAAKQLKVAVQQTAVDSNLQKLKLQYAKGTNGKVDDDEVEEGARRQPHDAGERLENIRNGLERSAIFVNLTKNDSRSPTPTVQAYYTKNKETYATPASRAVRHILVKTRRSPTRSTSSSRAATRSSRRSPRSTRSIPGSKKNGGKLGTIQKGQTVPTFDKVAFSSPTGKVAKPVKSCYGWHVIEATADTVPASQKPLDTALK